MSGGDILAQFLGWPWGKFRRPAEAARFHVVMIVTAPVILAALLRWRHRGTFVAAWEDVARVGSDLVRLRPGYARFSPVLRDVD